MSQNVVLPVFMKECDKKCGPRRNHNYDLGSIKSPSLICNIVQKDIGQWVILIWNAVMC